VKINTDDRNSVVASSGLRGEGRGSRDTRLPPVGRASPAGSVNRSPMTPVGKVVRELTRTVPADELMTALGNAVVYTIEVTTGSEKKAGTDAAVFVELVGDGGVASGAVPLIA
jgi:hypothetical protein